MGTTLPEASSNSDIDCPGVVELVRAIDGLQHLYALHVDMRVCVGHSSFQRLRERMNKLPNMRARCCAAELRRNFFDTDTWLRASEQRLLRAARMATVMSRVQVMTQHLVMTNFTLLMNELTLGMMIVVMLA
jgi:hypothetical protein